MRHNFIHLLEFFVSTVLQLKIKEIKSEQRCFHSSTDAPRASPASKQTGRASAPAKAALPAPATAPLRSATFSPSATPYYSS
jgi:hypothetical protein